MSRVVKLFACFGVVTVLSGALLSVAEAHLCDNVFREPDKLVVKPEITNIIVKRLVRFRLYLQNNMSRGITQIRLGGRSPAFEVKVSPEQMSVPAGGRVFFDVELETKPSTPSGSYPLHFRLYAVKGTEEQEYKRFELGSKVVYLVPRLAERKRTEEAKEGGEELIKVDGKATELAWREALAISNFRSTEGKLADPQTVVLIAFDPRAFYFALTCLEPEASSVGPRDSIALMFDRPSRKELYSVTLTGDGTLRMSVRKDSKVHRLSTEPVRLKVDGREKEWFTEMALPWAVFGMDEPPEPGEIWRLNIVRQRAVDGLETSFWAGSPDNYKEPENYAHLFFAPEP